MINNINTEEDRRIVEAATDGAWFSLSVDDDTPANRYIDLMRPAHALKYISLVESQARELEEARERNEEQQKRIDERDWRIGELCAVLRMSADKIIELGKAGVIEGELELFESEIKELLSTTQQQTDGE